MRNLGNTLKSVPKPGTIRNAIVGLLAIANDAELYRNPEIFEWIRCSAHRTDFPIEVLRTPLEMGDRQLIVGTCWDVKERKRAEEALRRSAPGFRFLFANSPLPMWIFSMATLRFLEVNDAATVLPWVPRAM